MSTSIENIQRAGESGARASDDLLEIARATGLRQYMHGVNATDARLILKRFVGALRFLRVDSDAPTVSATDSGLTTVRFLDGGIVQMDRSDFNALTAPTPPTSAADAVDAARYRWLRDESPLCLSDGNHDDPEFTNITDAAIDAAIAAIKEQ